MSGETEQNVSGWTTDTILAHLNVLLGERDRRYAEGLASLKDDLQVRDIFLERLAHERSEQVTIAFNAAQTASDKADKAYEKRFEGQNEFRDQLKDQAATFMPRKEYETAHQAVVSQLNNLELRMGANTAHSTGLRDGWGYLVGAVGSLLGVAGLIVALSR